MSATFLQGKRAIWLIHLEANFKKTENHLILSQIIALLDVLDVLASLQETCNPRLIAARAAASGHS